MPRKRSGCHGNMKCLGVDLRLPKLSLSDESVDRFAKSLDIGHVTQLPGVSGVSRNSDRLGVYDY